MNVTAIALPPAACLPQCGQAEPTAMEALLGTVLHTLPIGVCWQKEGENGGCWANESFLRLAGKSGGSYATLECFSAALYPEYQVAYAACLSQLRTGNADLLNLELRCRIDGEEESWRELTLRAIRDADASVSGLVLTLTDIDERKQLQRDMQRAAASADSLNDQIEIALDRAQRSAVEANVASAAIRQLAVLDELTGLYNRRGYNTLNPDLIQKIKSSDSRGYLCYFDLDRFKQINDEHGHAKGDEALVEFAAILRSTFREETLLVRLGGDEFVAMGVEHHRGQIEESLRALEMKLSIRNANGSSGFNLEASAGVTFFDATGPYSIEELSALADLELYKNKESRRSARCVR